MTTPPRWAWAVLLALYLLFAFIFSLIQPLGRTPDEAAHVSYVKFLAENGRLPLFDPDGGGEGGYEAQHPPLYYGAMAAVYSLTAPLAENWRWHAMRWATILLLGLPMFAISRRFFGETLGTQGPWALVATASVMLMPLTLLYTGYINPDGAAMVFVSLTLLLAWRQRLSEPDIKQALLLGAVAGLGALCKASAGPALIIALLAHCRAPGGSAKGYRLAWRDVGLTLLAFVAVAGWWYVNNWWLYGTPLIHTTGRMGSGLENALRHSFPFFAWLTWRETYLSSWIQRGWFPAGFWNTVLYGLIIAMTVLGLAGLIRKRRTGGEEPLRLALNLSGLLLGLVFLGHQWAYWTMDVEFNAGGRYILVVMMGLVLLLVVGVRRSMGRWAAVALWGWVGGLIVMSIVSMWNIWVVLNPQYAPGWQIFQFPG